MDVVIFIQNKKSVLKITSKIGQEDEKMDHLEYEIKFDRMKWTIERR